MRQTGCCCGSRFRLNFCRPSSRSRRICCTLSFELGLGVVVGGDVSIVVAASVGGGGVTVGSSGGGVVAAGIIGADNVGGVGSNGGGVFVAFSWDQLLPVLGLIHLSVITFQGEVGVVALMVEMFSKKGWQVAWCWL